MQALPLYNAELTASIPTANFTPMLNPDQCQDIMDNLKGYGVAKDAEVGVHVTDKEKRDTLVHPIPQLEETQWLYEIVADRVGRCNMVEFQFNVAGIFGDMQMLEYNVGSHYDWHVDIGPGEAAYRKLSVIIQLSNPDDYEGGEVVFNAGTERELPRDRGQIAVFPSWVLHKVNPVTKGTRYSLVTWVQGHERFK